MHLPEILEARRRMDDPHRVGLAALARAVVHDRRRAAAARARAPREFEIAWPWCETTNRSTVPIAVGRAHQIEFLVPRQVAEMRDAELAEVTMLPTDCAFSVLSTSCGLKSAQYGFGLAAAGQRAS